MGSKNRSNDPHNNQHNPQYANYWAPLTRKRHLPPHPAQPRHTNDWAPRTRKRHQREHRPQRPTERSDPTQHAKGRTGDCPGPREGATTRRNVTRGGGGALFQKGRLGLGTMQRSQRPVPRLLRDLRWWIEVVCVGLCGWRGEAGRSQWNVRLTAHDCSILGAGTVLHHSSHGTALGHWSRGQAIGAHKTTQCPLSSPCTDVLRSVLSCKGMWWGGGGGHRKSGMSGLQTKQSEDRGWLKSCAL